MDELEKACQDKELDLCTCNACGIRGDVNTDGVFIAMVTGEDREFIICPHCAKHNHKDMFQALREVMHGSR